MKRKRKPKDQRTTVILILLVLAAILVRLLIIYVSEGILYSKYNDPAIEGEYYRGTIYDSKGNLLALDVPRYNLVLDAGSITNPARLSSLIADYTTLSAIQIEDMLMKSDGVLVLESTLGNDGLEEFRSLLKKNDVSDLVQIEKSLERVYPTGEHGALLIGRLKDTVGAYGAEKIFEERLEYPLVFTGGIIKGEDVTLAFELEMQYAIDTVIQTRMRNNPGSLLMMAVVEEDTGCILALGLNPRSTDFDYFAIIDEALGFPSTLEERSETFAAEGKSIFPYKGGTVVADRTDGLLLLALSQNEESSRSCISLLRSLLSSRGYIKPGNQNVPYQDQAI